MKKRYILGSAIVALLMLVSTQIVFLNTVRSSDPTVHEGDADAGDLWISELDVSSDLTTMDFIGISHANATDDWVYWTSGNGNINVSWDVDIEARNHPEYYVIFSMAIFNVDDNCNEIGNDTFTKTYTAGLGYDESGTLSASVSFTQQQQQAGSQTLVCYISGLVKINDTTEAENFTVWADDRSIVAVDFADPGDQPLFPTYRAEANDVFPNMWSWIPGWDSHFSSEDEMLEGQSVLIGGAKKAFGNEEWHLGNLTVTSYSDGTLTNQDCVDEQYKINWSNESGSQWIYGDTYMYYKVSPDEQNWNPPIHFVYWLWAFNNATGKSQHRKFMWATWKWHHTNNTGRLGDKTSFNTEMANESDIINCTNYVFIFGCRPQFWYNETIPGYEVNVSYDGTGNNANCGGNNISWDGKCAVFNDSYTISTTSDTSGGITTITGDISNGLARENEIVFTHAADNGDTRIVLSC